MSQLREGRPEAAQVIWDWRGSDAAPPPGPALRNPRLAGTLQALFGAGVAVAIYQFGSQTIGSVVFCIASIILFSALVSPTGLYRGIQGLFAALGNATGRAVTWLMLVPLFYLFFLPFGQLMRRGRRDRMKRYFEPESESYWEPHKVFKAADHERLF